ncbi:hypothetical protein [Carboxylicivirga marina]|uniref:hypothetical protein n=1 Tax=Carboxylicivirga marina TaxID=2800988 RepID=UPI0025948059|nr:hypothetical protein [uncultured Carboxylicivirga sp.]
MNELILALNECSFDDVTNKIETTGKQIVITNENREKLKQLKQLMILLDERGHLR